jgi:drug/metabolite transporter (DMT)-like permease
VDGPAALSSASAVWLATCQLMLVALLWGTTNPCINRASKDKQADASAPPPGLLPLLRNWRFVVPFLLNQLGSLLYLGCLSSLSLSFAVPTVNALSMLLTAVTAHVLGERNKINKRIAAGMVLMLAGICTCILSEQQQQRQGKEEEQ